MTCRAEAGGPLHLTLADPAATARLAAQLARLVRPGDILALHGALGSGKTSFARAFITALAGQPVEVPSPTFTLVQTYATPMGEVWHFDLYRLQRPAEAFELGIEEAFAEGISLIEWPDRLGPLLPTERLDVMLEEPEGSGAAATLRLATLVGQGGWAARLAALPDNV